MLLNRFCTLFQWSIIEVINFVFGWPDMVAFCTQQAVFIQQRLLRDVLLLLN